MMTRRRFLVTGILLVLFVSSGENSLAQAPATAPAVPAAAPADAIRVMSFNIRYDTPKDVANPWAVRRSLVVGTIRSARVDLLGAQEVLAHQADYLREQMPEFGFVGVGRNDGDRSGEFSPIFFRTDRFERLDAGTFWLSPTPDVPGSKGWDANIPRIATWVKLRDKQTGRELVFVNTHWDHQGLVARRESGKLIRARLAELAGDAPVVLTGDLNADEASDGVVALMTSERPETRLIDSYRAAHPQRAADEGTYHGFAARTKGERIDFILHTPHLTTLEAAIDRTHADGKYPSDHYPVTAVLAWDRAIVP